MESSPTILYVDDDENDVLLLRHALRCAKLSFQVKVVNDPEKASAYLSGQGIYSDRKLHPMPAMVLLDLKMPRVDGLEILEWIRNQPGLEQLVVVVFTASDQMVEVNRAYEMGANSYLVKPVEIEALIEIVKGMTTYWINLHRSSVV